MEDANTPITRAEEASPSQKPVRRRANNPAILKTHEYLRFVKWSALPEPLREPDEKDQVSFAKKYKVAPQTLSEWKKRDDFLELVKGEIKEWAKDKTPNVVFGLYRKAVKEGNAQEVKLWLQWVLGEVFHDAPQSQTNVQVNVLNMTDEQLSSAIKAEVRAVKELQARLGEEAR